jgi:hypothetical protein
MRTMLSVLITLLLLAGGAVALWYVLGQPQPGEPMIKRVEELAHPTPPEPEARPPQDYHILQDQGGIPKAEAQRAGLSGAGYTYLRASAPIQMSEGVDLAEAVSVRAKSYDFCYRFETRPPQEQYLEFNIGGKWDTLDFGFGFSDSEPSEAKGEHAIIFEVQLDGKVAYTSPELRPVDKPIFTTIPVTGVNRVMFMVRRMGYNNTFAPILLDPFLKTAPAPAGT